MLVKMKNVEKHYGQFKLSCSLSLEEGQVTGLIGQNGAGKSTAFKAILGLIQADTGEIQVLGKDCKKLTEKDREQIGTVLSDSGFGTYMTVKQIASIQDAAYGSFQKESFLNSCRNHGLPIDKKIKEFSTGMKAKLKVLSALAHDARLLILDEPTAGLDVVARDEILDMLREYMEDGKRGILISSHISSDLENLCDDLYMIQEGQIVLHEDTDVILSEYGLLKMDESQYTAIDKEHIFCVKKEKYGYSCLTKERRFYQENYPSIVVEKCGIDQIETLMIGGRKK